MSDETFREVADLLFGGGADELVSKFEPDGADLHVRGTGKKKTDRAKVERRQAQIGLASNVVGIGAGAAGTYEAGKHWNEQRKTPSGRRQIKRIKVTGRTKALAAGALGLQVGNLVGDAVANRVLARAAKKEEPKETKFKKSIKEIPEPAQNAKTKGEVTRAATGVKSVGLEAPKGKFKQLPNKVKTKNVKKSADLDIKWEGEISKMNVDKQQVFGWASIVEMNGEPIVDMQGDYISIDEVEKAGYQYVQKSRKGGDMHLRDEFNHRCTPRR